MGFPETGIQRQNMGRFQTEFIIKVGMMARVVSGIMEHLREKRKSSPQFKTNLATLGISN